MTYTKISPLGPRIGIGTFDTINVKEKYPDMNDAIAAKECVVVDFVKDEEGVIYFCAYHAKHVEDKLYRKLSIQYFPVGIDLFDDEAAMEMAIKLLEKYA